MLRIGRTSFIHSDPAFYWLERNKPADVKIINAEPKQLTDLLLRGELDAAPVPTASLAKHSYELIALPGHAIYSKGRALSVLVIKSKESKASERSQVNVTRQATTSTVLLNILNEKLGLNFYVNPVNAQIIEDLLRNVPLALVIGDEGLRARLKGYEIAMDLGEAWWKLTKEPMVFAILATTKRRLNADPLRIARTVKLIETSIGEGERNISEIVKSCSTVSGIPPQLLSEHFKAVRLDYGGIEKGLQLFLSEARLGRYLSFKEIQIAGFQDDKPRIQTLVS